MKSNWSKSHVEEALAALWFVAASAAKSAGFSSLFVGVLALMALACLVASIHYSLKKDQ